ncbi:PorP/SprF family type IX secretion system membrane protein [Ekhidna sp.]
MKRLIIHITIACIAFSFLVGNAQQTAGFSQYYMNPFLLNPAAAGTGDTQAFLQYRNQWINIDGSPETYAFTLDGKLKRHPVGLGITFLNDVTNFINRTNLGITSSYILKLAKDHELSFGMTFMLIQNRVDFDKVIAQDFSDPNLFSSIDQKPVFELNSGLQYRWKGGLGLGIVADQLLQSELTYEDPATFGSLSFALIRHYTAILNYDIKINENFGVEPILIGRVAQGLPSQYDASLYGKYKDILWLGAAYRDQIGWAYSLGFNVFDNLRVGYTYELSTTGLDRIGGPTHELAVGWNFGKSLFGDGVSGGIAEQKDREGIKKLRRKNDEIDAKLDSINKLSDSQYVILQAKLDSINEINKFQQEEINALSIDFQGVGESLNGRPIESNDGITDEQEAILERYNISSEGYIPSIIKSRNILFGAGKHKIDPIYSRKLDELVQWLVINESVKLKLVGHADASGNPLPALKLSEKRVQEVKNYLVRRNVSEERIATEVEGSTAALSQGDAAVNRKFNRRVEILLDE